jgi:hypothetical protein
VRVPEPPRSRTRGGWLTHPPRSAGSRRVGAAASTASHHTPPNHPHAITPNHHQTAPSATVVRPISGSGRPDGIRGTRIRVSTSSSGQQVVPPVGAPRAPAPAGLLLAPGRLQRVRAAVRHRPLPVRRSLVDALVEEVRVRRREHIAPVLRLPNGRHRPMARFAQGSLGRPERIRTAGTALRGTGRHLTCWPADVQLRCRPPPARQSCGHASGTTRSRWRPSAVAAIERRLAKALKVDAKSAWQVLTCDLCRVKSPAATPPAHREGCRPYRAWRTRR